jgi:hypothetical protein
MSKSNPRFTLQQESTDLFQIVDNDTMMKEPAVFFTMRYDTAIQIVNIMNAEWDTLQLLKIRKEERTG